MATNATTWFYAEPETGRPYFITERLTHTFWANRLQGVYLQCVNATPPYRVEGTYNGSEFAMIWVPNDYFVLESDQDNKALVSVCTEVLGFRPAVSYTDADGIYSTEWYVKGGSERLREVQGNPAYKNVKKYR